MIVTLHATAPKLKGIVQPLIVMPYMAEALNRLVLQTQGRIMLAAN